jgi:hypothetical protein
MALPKLLSKGIPGGPMAADFGNSNYISGKFLHDYFTVIYFAAIYLKELLTTFLNKFLLINTKLSSGLPDKRNSGQVRRRLI